MYNASDGHVRSKALYSLLQALCKTEIRLREAETIAPLHVHKADSGFAEHFLLEKDAF